MSAYWAQWNHEEIEIFHDIDEVDTNLSRDEDDTETCQHSCTSCMDCLGLSWGDFL